MPMAPSNVCFRGQSGHSLKGSVMSAYDRAGATTCVNNDLDRASQAALSARPCGHRSPPATPGWPFRRNYSAGDGVFWRTSPRNVRRNSPGRTKPASSGCEWIDLRRQGLDQARPSGRRISDGLMHCANELAGNADRPYLPVELAGLQPRGSKMLHPTTC
jgi:hypothetical protein